MQQKPIELNNFKLPIVVSVDNDYLKELELKLQEFLGDIKGRKLIDDAIFNRASENVEKILKAMEYYYDADISNAQIEIHEVLEKYIENHYIVSSINKSPAVHGPNKVVYSNANSDYEFDINFYKARKGQDFTKTDMLHIPFDKRGLVSTQRFSIAGIPCMYLGLTSYVCWMELEKPSDSEFSVSSFILPPHVKILNLAIPQHLINGLSNDEEAATYVKSLVELFPLIIATSFRVKETGRSFRSEYIISQLVMQCLPRLKIDGVAYISKRVENDSWHFPHAVNLAIPMMSRGKDKYSDFAENIELTEPVNFSMYGKYAPGHQPTGKCNSFANRWDTDFSYLDERIHYSKLSFSQFDNYLYTKEHKKI